VLFPIGLVELGDLWHERVIRIGIRKQRTNRQQNFTNGQSRRPVVLQDVQTDAATGVDVAVINFGGETNLGRLERIIRRELDLQIEHAVLVRGLGRSHDGRDPVEEVVAVLRSCTAVCRCILSKILPLLLDALLCSHGEGRMG